MRIVTWNCNGALRRKAATIDTLNADILIVQECENPVSSSAEYQRWAGVHLWSGSNKNRGLGVFLRRGRVLERLDWDDNGFQQFLPVRIDRSFDLLAVWTKHVASPRIDYSEQFWNYLQLHKSSFDGKTMIFGDFNSSSIWDRPGRIWNHSECIRELENLGFTSLYHQSTQEPQGREHCPTLYLQRNLNKPYHIDYAFAQRDILPDGWTGAAVGKAADWLPHSDHMPLIVDL